MSRFSSSDGVEIAYQVWGEAGNLPPVVLHHGFMANFNTNWVLPGIVTVLTNAGRQVVALDARGHGESDKPHDPAFYGDERMSQDLRKLFDILGAKSIDLVGYSMGAIVSLITASQDDRIRRLVVGGVGASLVERAGTQSRESRSGLLVAALKTPDPGTITDPIAASFRAFADRVGVDREAAAAQAAAIHTGPIALNKITAPTLLIDGESDPLAVQPEVLAGAIPDARLLLLPGDHLSVVREARFASAIVDFLAV